jgi:phosphoribosylamine--glycine ligase
MKVLVIGGGGREHALAWKLAQSSKVQLVYVAPGNAGTGADPRLRNVGITDFERLADFAVAEKIALTVVGPEAALAAGIVDRFRARRLRIFGPSRAAAQLESSKAFAKDFMRRHGIPTAAYAVFEDAAAAHAHVEAEAVPIVVKADGLARRRASSSPAMAAASCRWRRARTTSACSTATWGRTPGAWARTRRRRW